MPCKPFAINLSATSKVIGMLLSPNIHDNIYFLRLWDFYDFE